MLAAPHAIRSYAQLMTMQYTFISQRPETVRASRRERSVLATAGRNFYAV